MQWYWIIGIIVILAVIIYIIFLKKRVSKEKLKGIFIVKSNKKGGF